jgi:hypothetical protein
MSVPKPSNTSMTKTIQKRLTMSCKIIGVDQSKKGQHKLPLCSTDLNLI